MVTDLTPEEQKHADALARALRRQGGVVAASIQAEDSNLRGALDASGVLILRALRPYWASIIPHAARDTYQAATKAVTDWEEFVRRYIETQGAGALGLINQTTWRLVVRVLEAGLAEGLGTAELARQLRREWPEISRVRAERIVRTEGTAARAWASLEGARRAEQDFGLVLEKVWISAHDERTRFNHLDADQQRVPLSAPFLVGGESLLHPGDRSLGASGGNTINCRCTVAFEPVEVEVGGDSLPGPATFRSVRTWRVDRDARMRSHYEAVKGRFPTWVQAVEDVQENIEEAKSLSFERVRRICHSRVSAHETAH